MTRGVALAGFGGETHYGCGLRLDGRLPPADGSACGPTRAAPGPRGSARRGPTGRPVGLGSLASAGRHIAGAVGGWTAGWRLRTDMPAARREPPPGREGPHAGAAGETRGVALAGFGAATHCGSGRRLGSSRRLRTDLPAAPTEPPPRSRWSSRRRPSWRPVELRYPASAGRFIADAACGWAAGCRLRADRGSWKIPRFLRPGRERRLGRRQPDPGRGAGQAIFPDRPSSPSCGQTGRRRVSGCGRSGSGSPSGPLAEGGAAPGALVTAQVRVSPSPARGDGRYPTARNGHPVRRRRRRNPPSRGGGRACPQ